MGREASLQDLCVSYLDSNWLGRLFWFSVPNERKDRTEIGKLVRMGMRKGMTDLVVLGKGKQLFVELKTDIGRLSMEQKLVHKQLRALGYEVELVREFELFKSLIELHFGGVGVDEVPKGI
jgi:hypothetical protein